MGGGYDDLAFLGGHAYIAASNPTLNGAGINVFPAVDEVTLNPDHSTTLTSILMGNTKAMDLVANASVTLNEVDPDSMTIHPAYRGELVLIDQAGSEIVTIANPDYTADSHPASRSGHSSMTRSGHRSLAARWM
jgi:hypothetical protein